MILAVTEPLDVGSSLVALVGSGALDLPLPGGGTTAARFEALAELGALDLSLARLAEGHADAVAILAEAGRTAVAPRSPYGVWAADPPASRLHAVPEAGGSWSLHGRKRYCSGARTLTHALVTGWTDEGLVLVEVALDQDAVRPVDGTWPALGMAGSESLDVDFEGAVGSGVGATGWYLDRPGFWHGSVGVAACWYGGARGAADVLAAAVGEGPSAHQLAHLGAVVATCSAMGTALRAAATAIDDDPLDAGGDAHRRALTVRAVVEAGCTSVLERVGRATGSGPLCFDGAHARRAADLPVYLRQSHAEADLAELGRLALGDSSWR